LRTDYGWRTMSSTRQRSTLTMSRGLIFNIMPRWPALIMTSSTWTLIKTDPSLLKLIDPGSAQVFVTARSGRQRSGGEDKQVFRIQEGQ